MVNRGESNRYNYLMDSIPSHLKLQITDALRQLFKEFGSKTFDPALVKTLVNLTPSTGIKLIQVGYYLVSHHSDAGLIIAHDSRASGQVGDPLVCAVYDTETQEPVAVRDKQYRFAGIRFMGLSIGVTFPRLLQEREPKIILG